MFKKKVTTELIEQYLDRYGWPQHQTMPELETQGMVVTGWHTASGDQYVMSIDPIVEKHALVFQVFGIVLVDADTCPAERMQQLLVRLLSENKALLIGAFGFDADTNMVFLKQSIPIAAEELAYEDFEYCMRGLTMVTELKAPELRAIVESATTVPSGDGGKVVI